MLGYRSYFTVAGVAHGQQMVPAALAQLYAWIRSKRYDADAIVPGATVQIGPGVEATLTLDTEADGSESVFFLMQEKSPAGLWTSQLLLHDPHTHRRDPWVWLDVIAPDSVGAEGSTTRPRWTARPRLAQSLLEVLDGRDGGARLDPEALVASPDDVDDLAEALRDPHRRGPVFVAGSDDTLPLQPWTELVRALLRQTTGLAAGYVLDADATRRFARAVGPRHAVAPGTMRTFMRGVDTTSDLDALRHPVLGTERIVQDRSHRVVRVLGETAREAALAVPLPRHAVRVEELLLRRADDDFLAARQQIDETRSQRVIDHIAEERTAKVVAPPTPEPAAWSVAPPVEPSGPGADLAPDGHDDLAGRTEAPADLGSVETHLALAAALQSVLGESETNAEAIERLRERALAADRLALAIERKDQQIGGLTRTVVELRDAVAESTRRLEDEQVEHRETSDRELVAERTVHALRMRLQDAERYEDAWADPSQDEIGAEPPESFGQLLDRFSEFPALVWTGDGDPTELLDVRDPLGRWARKAWSALQALQDYTVEHLAGRAHTVDDYLSNTPATLHGFPANRHARDESDDVKQNSKYRGPRVLRVPRSVDATGSVFMGAHFKIAQSGMISPRMHYHDAVDIDGHVYVGYLGPHLPTQKTN
ncbi:hypothetical protein AB0O99_07750 [Cellulosimicrobium funkei]|uniref:hypothetical protein n=1 Tax=Cellulosimicrobium funkei TaxID=264251 RepID=UPI00343135E8